MQRTSLVVSVLLACCGGLASVPPSDAGADGGLDASADAVPDLDSGGLDAGFDGGADGTSACTYFGGSACNTLPKGAIVDVGCTTSPPAAQGGPLVDGDYNLVQVDWDGTAHACPGATLTRRGAIEICGTTLIWDDIDETQAEWRGNTTIAATAASLSFSESCPSSETWSFDYTATNGQLIIFFAYPSGERLVMTFQRQ